MNSNCVKYNVTQSNTLCTGILKESVKQLNIWVANALNVDTINVWRLLNFITGIQYPRNFIGMICAADHGM